MERNQLIAIAVIVIVIAGAGAAFVFMQQPTKPPENVLIHETIGNPDHMDPHVNYETFGGWIAYNVYETLYTYPFGTDSTVPSTPLLASSMPVVSADGLNYTIDLREGITFQDGTPFNASCVKWNIERAMKIFYPDGPIWMLAEPLKGGIAVELAAFNDGPSSPEFKTAFDDWVANSNSIIVIDEYTVRFVLEDPYPPFIPALTYAVGSMMSPSYCIAHATDDAWATWETYGVDYGEIDGWMDSHACGTGPYELVEWVPDQFIHLVLYEDYWRMDTTDSEVAAPDYAGSLEEIYVKTNEDVNGRILNIRTGTTDTTYWPTTNADEIWDPVAEESLDPNIYISTGGLSFSVTFFGFNMGTFNTTEGVIVDAPFSFKNFRTAASYAFDYDAFMNAAVNGIGIQAKGPVPQGMVGHNGSMYTFEYDLDAAVAEWNLAMQDPNFVNTLNEMNNRLTLYYNSGNTVREQGSLLLADGLTNLYNHPDADHTGLDADMTFTTQALEWSNYLDHIRNRQMPIFFVGWAPDYADADNYIFPFCYQYGTYAMRIGYNNTNVNDWYEAAKIETDTEVRQTYFDQIQEQVAEDTPYLWVYQIVEFRAWRTWMHGDGLVYNPMHSAYWFHMYKDYTT